VSAGVVYRQPDVDACHLIHSSHSATSTRRVTCFQPITCTWWPTNTASGANPITAAASGTVGEALQAIRHGLKDRHQGGQQLFTTTTTTSRPTSQSRKEHGDRRRGHRHQQRSGGCRGFWRLQLQQRAAHRHSQLVRCKRHQVRGSPLKYYTGATQTTLYGKITVSGGATKDGKFRLGRERQAGGQLGAVWRQFRCPSPDKGLAFAYNVSNHGLRISMGSSLSGGGAYAVQAAAADFNTVTQATGQVNYRLFPPEAAIRARRARSTDCGGTGAFGDAHQGRVVPGQPHRNGGVHRQRADV